jgi:hypothetical protein
MLREMDFVENDWAALFWAIGSATAILKGMDTPMKDLTYIHRKMQSFEKGICRRSILACAVNFLECVAFGSFIFIFPNPLQRIGSCLIVASTMLFFALHLYARRADTSSLERGSPDCSGSFRAKLARRGAFHFATNILPWVVPFIPGWGLFFCGLAISHPEIARHMYLNAAVCSIFIILGSLGPLLVLELVYKYKHQIDELDALQKAP